MTESSQSTPSASQPRPAPPPRRVSGHRILLLAAGAAFGGLLLAEAAARLVAARVTPFPETSAGARIFLPGSPQFLVRMTPRGKRLVPDAHVLIQNHYLSGRDIPMDTNALGFRSGPLPPSKSPIESRILALGDSITWADYLPLEETWTGLLEKDLTSRARRRIPRVINAGVGDTGIREQIRLLEDDGIRALPDLVILAFYLNDARPPWGFAGAPGSSGWLRRHSVLAETLHRRFRLKAWLKAVGEEQFRWIDYMKGADWRNDPEAFRKGVELARNDWGAAWREEEWPRVAAELDRLGELARDGKFRVMIAAFPAVYQVESIHLDDAPQRRLAALAAERGFAFADLLPDLRKRAGEGLYFDHCHPNAAGNAAIASALAESVARAFPDLLEPAALGAPAQ